MKTATSLRSTNIQAKKRTISKTPQSSRSPFSRHRCLVLKAAGLCAALRTLCQSLLLAQPPAAAYPDPQPGPCWKIPAPPTSWKINFRYTKPLSEAETEIKPSSIIVTLLGEDSHHLIKFGNSFLDVWKTAGRAFICENGSPAAFPHNVGKNKITFAIEAKDAPPPETIPEENLSPQNKDWPSFPELEWVTPEMYKGKMMLGAQTALIYADVPADPIVLGKADRYVKKWPAGPLGGIPLQPGMRALAVAENTRLPMVLQLGDEFREYTFQTGEVQKIELPAKVKVFLENSRAPGKRPPSISANP